MVNRQLNHGHEAQIVREIEMSRFIQSGVGTPSKAGRPKKPTPLPKPGAYTAKNLENTKPIYTYESGKK